MSSYSDEESVGSEDDSRVGNQDYRSHVSRQRFEDSQTRQLPRGRERLVFDHRSGNLMVQGESGAVGASRNPKPVVTDIASTGYF